MDEELTHNILGKLKQRSNCPFAQKANIEVFGWNEKNSMAENLELLSIQLKKLTLKVNSHGLAVIMAPQYGNSISTLAHTTKSILSYLSNMSSYACMQSDMETKEYQFSFFGTRFFILTLAPVYPFTHSRYIFDLEATVVFFQTELSFERKRVCKKTEAMNIRATIRNLFRQAGRSYDNFSITGKEVTECIDIYKYVKPLYENDAPIRWREEDEQPNLNSLSGNTGLHLDK